MIKQHLSTGLSLLGRTAPFIFLEILGAFGMVILLILYFGLLIFIAGQFDGGMRVGFFVAGGLAGLFIYRVARAIYLYLIKAAHIGAMMGLLDERAEAQKAPVGYGFQVVKENVGSFFTALGVDWVVSRVSRGVQRILVRMTRWIPIKGLEGFIQVMLRVTLGFIDELVWAYIVRTPEGTLWQRAKAGLRYLAGGWKSLISVGAILALIYWSMNIVIGGLGLLIGGVFDVVGALFFGLLAGFLLLIRWAVFEPFALAVMISCYHHILTEEKIEEANINLLEQVPAFRRLEKMAAAGA